MARKNADDQPAEDATSPAIEAIDPRQVEANHLTSTPEEEADARVAERPNPKDDPAGPNDVSNVVDPSDPMTLTGHDAEPGENGQ
jgi:hypothetical protein